MTHNPPTPITDYIFQFPPEVQEKLNQMRDAILEIVPTLYGYRSPTASRRFSSRATSSTSRATRATSASTPARTESRCLPPSLAHTNSARAQCSFRWMSPCRWSSCAASPPIEKSKISPRRNRVNAFYNLPENIEFNMICNL